MCSTTIYKLTYQRKELPFIQCGNSAFCHYYVLPLSKNKCRISAASLILRWSFLFPSQAGVSTLMLTCAVEIQHLFMDRGSSYYSIIERFLETRKVHNFDAAPKLSRRCSNFETTFARSEIKLSRRKSHQYRFQSFHSFLRNYLSNLKIFQTILKKGGGYNDNNSINTLDELC